MIRNMTVRDIMAKKLVTFQPDTNILHAIDTLLRHRISGATVVDENGDIVGVLSEIDCMKKLIQSVYHNEMGGLVSEFMSTEITTVQASAGLVEVAELFLEKHFRRLPVVVNGRLVGQVSRSDVLRAIQRVSK